MWLLSMVESGCWKMGLFFTAETDSSHFRPRWRQRSFKAGQARVHTVILYLFKLFLDNVAPPVSSVPGSICDLISVTGFC